eukprot:c8580_g1_i1.p2 GENE.c8580_g1_i1~~c8580_g1_i1.p2  ORF type:complete len:106 (+),score=14.27 c8580_g1_i1:213-530(+)
MRMAQMAEIPPRCPILDPNNYHYLIPPHYCHYHLTATMRRECSVVGGLLLECSGIWMVVWFVSISRGILCLPRQWYTFSQQCSQVSKVLEAKWVSVAMQKQSISM